MLIVLVVLGGLVPALRVSAQPAEVPEERPMLGVALSGGGAKGFAHIGVLKVLEAVGLPVDAVAGTSMGAVVGGIYAMGYTSEMLEAIAHAQDWDAMFSRSTPRYLQPVEQRIREERFLLTLPLRQGRPRLPVGLIPGQRIAQTLARLTLPVHGVQDFTKLPVPFACVATDLETGQGVRLDRGSLPDAIRASLAIPTVFSPVKIGQQTYIDGGVARNLPAQDARALGANVVVCVDVTSPLEKADSLNSLVDILKQAVDYRIKESTLQQRQYCDVLIQPDLDAFSILDFDQAAAIIRQGEVAAEAALPRLRVLADSVGRVQYPRRKPPPLEDSVFVDQVQVEDLGIGLERQVQGALGLAMPRWLTGGDLEEAIERVYSRQLFERVTYRLEPNPDGPGTQLVLRAVERDRRRLGVGVRYDSHYRAAVLLDAATRAFGRKNLNVHFRLGEVLQLGGRLGWQVVPSRLGVRLLLQATRAPIDVFDGDSRVSSVRTEVLEAEARISLPLSNSLVISLGVGSELFNLNRSVGVTSFLDEARGLFLGTGRLLLDTFDRSAFAGRGHRLTITTGVGSALNDAPFTHHLFEWQARWAVSSRFSVISKIMGGQVYGSAIPLHYQFHIGGAFSYEYGSFSARQFPLQGFEVQELGGRSMQGLVLGGQYRLGEDTYVAARWNAAHVSNEKRWSIDPDAYRRGIGLTVGARTLVGPLAVTLVSRSARGPYDLHVSVGHGF